MDTTALLEPRDDDAPSGENLEYDPLFTDLELAAQPGEERQMGDDVMTEDGPDYRDVQEKALAVMEKSHDLRAAVYLARAALNNSGLPGFADAVSYMRGCLEQYWDTCHPQLDEDDDDDPTMRVNAVLTLTDSVLVLRPLRKAPLTESRAFGRISLRDIQIAEGEVTAGEDEAAPDSASVTAAFKDTDADVLEGIVAAAQSASDDIKAISDIFDDKTPGQGPDLDGLLKILRSITVKLSEYGGVGSVEEEEAADEAGDAAPAAAASGGGVGGINSPNDVVNALDRIMDYYKRCEPSSPLPILLDRAKRLVNADFVTIIKDMAPSGVENVNLIGGLEDEDGY